MSNLPTVWTNVLTALLLSGSQFTILSFVLPAFSMSLFYSGGMCLNDIVDRRADSVYRPDRPIPSGRVSPGRALFLTTVLFAFALFGFFLRTGFKAFFAGALLLGFIIAYDFFHKKFRTSIFLMAGCRFMVFVAVSSASGRFTNSVLAGAFAQFVYTLAISSASLFEKLRQKKFSFPVIPFMIAGISVIDGLLLFIFISPQWLAAGLLGAVLTLIGQKFARGD